MEQFKTPLEYRQEAEIASLRAEVSQLRAAFEYRKGHKEQFLGAACDLREDTPQHMKLSTLSVPLKASLSCTVDNTAGRHQVILKGFGSVKGELELRYFTDRLDLVSDAALVTVLSALHRSAMLNLADTLGENKNEQ